LQKSWCPLDLNIHDGLQLAKTIWTPERFEEMFPRFSSWLSGSTLLPRLRQLQMELDPVGVLENDKNDEQFRAAMTLRDCTVFVRFPENAQDDQYGIEARIGDLDLKSPDKAQYWKDTENALIEEGWYTGTEKKEDRQPLTCQLSPKLEDAMREMLLSNS
jgi:inositol-pentakisphosphate 2-kinase